MLFTRAKRPRSDRRRRAGPAEFGGTPHRHKTVPTHGPAPSRSLLPHRPRAPRAQNRCRPATPQGLRALHKPTPPRARAARDAHGSLLFSFSLFSPPLTRRSSAGRGWARFCGGGGWVLCLRLECCSREPSAPARIAVEEPVQPSSGGPPTATKPCRPTAPRRRALFSPTGPVRPAHKTVVAPRRPATPQGLRALHTNSVSPSGEGRALVGRHHLPLFVAGEAARAKLGVVGVKSEPVLIENSA